MKSFTKVFRKSRLFSIVRRGFTMIEVLAALSLASLVVVSILPVILKFSFSGTFVKEVQRRAFTAEHHLWYHDILSKFCSKRFLSELVDQKNLFTGKEINNTLVSKLTNAIVFMHDKAPAFVRVHENAKQNRPLISSQDRFLFMLLERNSEDAFQISFCKQDLFRDPNIIRPDFNYIGSLFVNTKNEGIKNIYLKPVYTADYIPGSVKMIKDNTSVSNDDTWKEGRFWDFNQENFNTLVDLGKKGQVSRIYFATDFKKEF